ncbi:MAG TPA: hypothetical protein VGW10_02405 [Solirubrobacteraceae bacterium]|nr:hypothetical protein [Solirubrobacteraceae bacterium]
MTPLCLRTALCALALTLLAAAPAAAQTSQMEGVWTFSGGQIAVDRQGDAFVGTVVRPTQLSECVHETGEQIWTDIRLQGDGSYWGKHQYFQTSDCSFIDRGNTAYRVLNRGGQTFLRVCFSKPETPELQPKIAEDGSNTDTNDGCRDSEFVSPLPSTPPKLSDIVTLPKETKGCASRRKFAIRLKEPPGDALKAAVITLNRKKLNVVKRNGRLTSTVDLRGLPRGRYALKIVATTVRGRSISGTRRYRTCGKVRRIGRVGPI